MLLNILKSILSILLIKAQTYWDTFNLSPQIISIQRSMLLQCWAPQHVDSSNLSRQFVRKSRGEPTRPQTIQKKNKTTESPSRSWAQYLTAMPSPMAGSAAAVPFCIEVLPSHLSPLDLFFPFLSDWGGRTVMTTKDHAGCPLYWSLFVLQFSSTWSNPLWNADGGRTAGYRFMSPIGEADEEVTAVWSLESSGRLGGAPRCQQPGKED
jgi:hypothetical protein